MTMWDFANVHPYVALAMLFCLCMSVPSISWGRGKASAEKPKDGGAS